MGTLQLLSGISYGTGKIALCKIAPPPLTLAIVQTLTQIQGAGFVGGNLPLGNFMGDNFPIMVAILRKAIFQSRFKQCFLNKN